MSLKIRVNIERLHHIHGRPEGKQGGANAPPGFSHWVENLVKILTFCVTILTFGQNTNICSLLRIGSPYKNFCGHPLSYPVYISILANETEQVLHNFEDVGARL